MIDKERLQSELFEFVPALGISNLYGNVTGCDAV